MRKTKLWRGLTSAFILLLVVCISMTVLAFENSGQIDAVLGGAENSTGEADWIFASMFSDNGKVTREGFDALIEAEEAHNIKMQEEGSVLLSNRNNALPLTSAQRSVTMFGRATANPIYKCNSGGATLDATRVVNLNDALTKAGFSVNKTMYDALAGSTVRRVVSANITGNRSKANSNIGEVPVTFYTDTLKNSYASNYNDVAIVSFAREGGEGNDLTLEDVDGIPQLALHPQESDLLKMINASGKFSKTILLLNSAYPMELDFISDYSTYGIDACLWIGNPGLYGFHGVANLLTGAANPSGKLVDTYAADSQSSPAMQNFGNFRFTNDANSAYLVELEGIYVGYKYYETRYEDYILKQYGANSDVGTYSSSGSAWNYADEMVYPFGYGLSYTTFTQEIVANSFKYDTDKDEFTIKVKVTNTGSAAGKSVVELYVQQPYTAYDRTNLVEKAALQLVGFGKTGMLAKSGSSGNSEEVTITVDRYLLASYDSFKSKHYILDAGNYYFAIGDDSHDAMNNILAKKIATESISGANPLVDINGTVVTGNANKVAVYDAIKTLDETSYKFSAYDSSVEVTNKFTGDYAVDVNDFLPAGQKLTYLTRQNWTGTYPELASVAKSSSMETAMVKSIYNKPANAPKVSEIVTAQDNGLQFYEMYGVDYHDDIWDDFIAQLSLDELCVMVSDSGGTKVIKSVNKPKQINQDGPDGFRAKTRFSTECTTYVNEIVAASSWSYELIEERGTIYAESILYANGTQVWAPGANMHRTPYSGRNFEYYAEDSNLSSLLLEAQVKAMDSKGIVTSMKHFVANDQETNRSGACTFMTEQRLRQECLRGFELGFTKGASKGTMLSYNRIGCKMDSLSVPLLQDVLRGEWAFKGVIINDAENETASPAVDSLITGVDMFCLSGTRGDVIKAAINDNDDGNLLKVLQESAHHFFYAFANSNLINGLDPNFVVTDNLSWWQTSLIVVNIVVGLVTAAAAVMFVLGGYVFKRETFAKGGER